jgi:hypothetical protein
MELENKNEPINTVEKENTEKKEWKRPEMTKLAMGATKANPGGGPDGLKPGTSHS